jgi:hypothetical protein
VRRDSSSSCGGPSARGGFTVTAIRSLPGCEEAASEKLRPGGGGALGDQAEPAVTASRKSAVSATVRVTQPFTDNPNQCSASIGTRSRWGFRPKRPQLAAG